MTTPTANRLLFQTTDEATETHSGKKLNTDMDQSTDEQTDIMAFEEKSEGKILVSFLTIVDQARHPNLYMHSDKMLRFYIVGHSKVT